MMQKLKTSVCPLFSRESLQIAFLFICVCLVASCSILTEKVPETNLAPKLYPNALLAEPIKLRAGFVHVTQPFEITKMDEVWEVNVGFKRVDDKLPVSRFMCLVEPRRDMLRGTRKCANDDPGVNLLWELLDSRGEMVRYHDYDSLKDATGSQSSRNSLMLGLYTFYSPYKGMYRLRVTVLRDFPELDVTDPHIVLDRPFFGFMRH